MKFIKCYIDKNNASVIVDSGKEVEREMDMVLEELRNGDIFDGYLFLPSDRPNVGSPINPDVTREEYLENPAKYGVCVYRTWDGKVVFE